MYRLDSYASTFVTGQLANQERRIVGFLAPQIRIYRFDARGQCYQREAVELGFEIPQRDGIYLIYQVEDAINERLQQILAQEFAMPQPIEIEGFYDPDNYVGTADLPSHYQDFLDGEEDDYDPDERRELEQEIQEWRASGDYVFYWAEEYFVSPEGRVVAS